MKKRRKICRKLLALIPVLLAAAVLETNAAGYSKDAAGAEMPRQELVWEEEDVFGQKISRDEEIPEVHIEYGSRCYGEEAENSDRGNYRIPLDREASDVPGRENQYTYQLVGEEGDPIPEKADLPFTVDSEGILRIRRASGEAEGVLVKIIRKTGGYRDEANLIRVTVDRRRILLQTEDAETLFSASRVYDGQAVSDLIFTGLEDVPQNFRRQNGQDCVGEAVLDGDQVQVRQFQAAGVQVPVKDVGTSRVLLSAEQIGEISLDGRGSENYDVYMDRVPAAVTTEPRQYRVRIRDARREYGTREYTEAPALSRDSAETGFLEGDSEEEFEKIRQAVAFSDVSLAGSPMDGRAADNRYIHAEILREYAGNYHIVQDNGSAGRLIITRQILEDPLEKYVKIEGEHILSVPDARGQTESVWIRGDYEGEAGMLRLIPAVPELYSQVSIQADSDLVSRDGETITVKLDRGKTDEEGLLLTYRLLKTDGDTVTAETEDFKLRLRVDSAAPEITLTTPEGEAFGVAASGQNPGEAGFGAYSRGTCYVTASAADAGAGVESWSYAVVDVPAGREKTDWRNYADSAEISWTEADGSVPSVRIPVYEESDAAAEAVLENKIILIRASDRVGNSELYIFEGVSIDNSGPDITVEELKDAYAKADLVENAIVFRVKADDSGSSGESGKTAAGIRSVEYHLYDGDREITEEYLEAEDADDGQWRECRIIRADRLNSGRLRLTVTAQDRAGNRGEFQKSFAVDAAGPQIRLIPAEEEKYFRDNAEVDAVIRETNFSENDTVLFVSVDGKPEEALCFSGGGTEQIRIEKTADSREQADFSDWDENREVTYRLTFAEEGSFRIRLEAADGFGNKAASAELPGFVVDKTGPAVAFRFDDRGNPVQNGRYFQQERRAVLTVTDRNLDPSSLRLRVTAGNAGGEILKEICCSPEETEDNGYFTCSVRDTGDSGRMTVDLLFYGEASYRIESVSCADLAGRQADAAAGSGDVTVEGNSPFHFTVDRTAPSGTAALTAGGGLWDRFLEVLTFGIFSNHEETVTVAGQDSVSGLQAIRYVLLEEALTREELEERDRNDQVEWTVKTFGEGISGESAGETLSPGRRCVLYGKITDYAGRITYLSSDGFILDHTAPEVTVTLLDTENTDGVFSGSVRLRIDVADPEMIGAYSGLKEVGYTIESSGNVSGSGGEAWTADGSRTFSRVITADGDAYNSNDVRITAYALDRAENRGTASEPVRFGIDMTPPEISVVWDEQEPVNERYFSGPRTAAVTVRDRNFDAELVQFSISGTAGQARIGEWTVSSDMGVSDRAEAVCSVSFDEDGDYDFSVNCRDLAGNTAEWDEQEPFTIDRTAPEITVSYDNHDAQNGGYYRKARTATVAVRERNFRASDVQVSVRAFLDGREISAPSVSPFSDRGDLHTATVVCGADGEYSFDIRYTDLAGNKAADYGTDSFTIDRTAPEVDIFDILDRSANNDVVAPGVEYTDRNLDMDEVSVTLSGAGKGIMEPAGRVTDIPGGQRIQYSDFDRSEEMDDLYCLQARAADLAGNVTEKTVRFSVNRYGSVYVPDEATRQWLDENGGQYRYTNREPEIGIMEINVDEIREYSIAVDRDGELRQLKEGIDFTAEASRNDADWHVSYYRIRPEVFEEEGKYSVTLASTDRADNRGDNRTVRKSAGAVPVEFAVDKTAPTVVVSGIEDGGRYMSADRTFMVDAKDNLALETVEITVGDDEPLVCGREELLRNDGVISGIRIPADGELQTIRVTASDAAGNVLGQPAPGDGGVPLEMRVLVTPDPVAQYVKHRPLLWITAAGLSVAAAVALAMRKGKSSPR